MKRVYAIIGLLSIIFLFVGCGKKEIKQTGPTPSIKKTDIPTLFIHGYKGGKYSFGRMIDRLDSQDNGEKELVLTISSTGEVTEKQNTLKGTFKENNPMIQVLFEDNKNHEWNQASWLRETLLYLHEKYDVSRVNMVGHSMGGVSILRYLTQYGEEDELPKVNRFIAIGSPFNDFQDTFGTQTLAELLKEGPNQESERFELYASELESRGYPVETLLIAGELSEQDHSDGTVPVSSALSVYSLLLNKGYDVSYDVMKGKQAQHSRLHENEQVDEKVIDFLWGNELE